MKPYFLLILLFCARAAAQPAQITLTGTLKMSTGESFPYKIIGADSAGYIKGYSYTFTTPDETKAAITGRVDRRAHRLIFKETEVIYSHNFFTQAYMCLIDARLEYAGSVLKGPGSSRDAGNTACTEGTVSFTDEAELRGLFSTHEKFDTVISLKKRVHEPAAPVPEAAVPPPAAKAPVSTDKVTAGVEKMYEWHSDSVILYVWDGGDVDGDAITLECNGREYLTGYYLEKARKRVAIPLAPGKEITNITITAINEGTDPPNTASLLLADGPVQYSVVAYNPKGQKSLIRIKRVK